jgi:hypothetical protein
LLIVLVAGGSPDRTDAAGANSTGQETQVLAQPPPAPGDLRVLLVGDSVTSGFANYFQKDQVGGKMAIKNGAIIGCGYLEGERHEKFVAERRRYEERIRELFREGAEGSQLRTDLDVPTAALLFLSAANWAYTWLRPGADTDQLADRLYAALLDGMRGYATPD